MKGIPACLLAGALVLAASRDAGAYRVRSTHRWGLRGGVVDSLVLENESGNITVERWWLDSIDVEADLRVKAPSAGRARGLHAAVTFDVVERPGALAIRAVLPRIRQGAFGVGAGDFTAIRIRYRVRAPDRIALVLSVKNGRIENRANNGRI